MTKLLLLLLLTACSTIEYRSKGKIPVHFSKREKHTLPVQFSGRKEFFFWGQYPKKQIIYIDDLATELGMDGVAEIEIHEFTTPYDVIVSFLSFGMYTPRSFAIMAKGRAK